MCKCIIAVLENERKMGEAQRERVELLQKIEENKRQEKEQQEARWKKNLSHQSDLLSQMDYNQRLRVDEQVEEERTWRSQRSAEIEYRRKLEDALASDQIDKLHPMRRAFSGSATRHRNRDAMQDFLQ